MNSVEMLGPEGLIAAKLEDYETRPEQLAMAGVVADAVNSAGHLLVEAGTGVGKSFAYLMPLIEHSVSKHKTVVVSTNTISLQEQLIRKDIPFLRSVLAEEFTACLVKGRSNYVCLRRLALASRFQRSLLATEAELKELWRIENWAYQTDDGSLADFDRAPGHNVWTQVCSDRHTCGGKNCEHFERKCFFQRARRRMFNANLLVVNHHLLFSDMVLHDQKVSFLPGYDVLVLDEGHTVEAVAGEHLGIHVSTGSVYWCLNALLNPRSGKGFLVHMKAPDAVDAVRTARESTERFFKRVREWRTDNDGDNGRIGVPSFFEDDLSPALRELALVLAALKPTAKKRDEGLEISAHAERILDLAAGVKTFVEQSLEDYVYWVEAQGRPRPRVALECSPVSVAADLKRLMFDELRTVIITSATLCVGKTDRFDFIRRRLGVDDAHELQVGSPFDYDRQTRVYIPSGMPNPNDFEPFAAAVGREVERYVEHTHGKAFVLFTSYRLLREVAGTLHERLETDGIRCFVQGEGMPRTTMLERFREDTDSVIFGTDSFWQGVDVRGEALSNVIITRLPFAVPDHPVIQARLEKIRDEGGDPFMEYTIPDAVIRFKQGIGRLIRTKTDRGIIVVLDPRILTRRYGRLFRESIPTSRFSRGIDTEEVH